MFDLGGVLLNIDYQRTEKAFVDLGISNFNELYSQAQQSNLFDDFETGRISPKEFRNRLREITGINLTDHEIDKAWNAMLLDFPTERIELLKSLKHKGYGLFLLSNTNQIHYVAYTKYMQQELGIPGLEPFFIRSFFSHEIGKRKPEVETFNWALAEGDMKPEETLFIDDSIQHIEGAKNAGINAHWLQEEITIYLTTALN